MYKSKHPMIGKIVQINTSVASSWWEERHYTSYHYFVSNVVKVRNGRFLLHTCIFRYLPNQPRNESLEKSNAKGETINIYIEDVAPVENVNNEQASQLLESDY
jgi:hypothetical protein